MSVHPQLSHGGTFSSWLERQRDITFEAWERSVGASVSEERSKDIADFNAHSEEAKQKFMLKFEAKRKELS